jgi:hypothetical protein
LWTGAGNVQRLTHLGFQGEPVLVEGIHAIQAAYGMREFSRGHEDGLCIM